ncbi:MAG: rod shape-determining protein MreD [Rikenellaceae bacterium]|jgi:hypothetical protein|nr:rod shape-determining protein MreD [Rikenellaceae bacterium]
MPTALRYFLLFLTVTALQIFLFDNLQLSLYVHPFVYLAFVLLLPMEIKGFWLLIWAAVMGVTIDFFSGAPAVNTIATVAMAFCRPGVMRLFIGKEVIGDGGSPHYRRIGNGKFLRYASVLILIHAVIFFGLETLTTVGILFTLLRIAISVVCSLIAIELVQLVFVPRKS